MLTFRLDHLNNYFVLKQRIDVEWYLMSFDEEDDRYKLPTHCKFSAHLSNLLARKDSEMALKDKKF